MNEVLKINEEALMFELLVSLVDEKSDLFWTLPFSKETHDLIVYELFDENPISKV